MQDYLSPFLPTPRKVIRKMLEVSKPQPGEILIDIGSGPRGDVLIEAAKLYKIDCIGIELNPKHYYSSIDRIHNSYQNDHLNGSVEVVLGDAKNLSLKDADIVFTYLSTRGMAAIEDKIFSELKKSARLVSNEYGFKKVKPNETHGIFARAKSIYPQLLPTPFHHSIKVYYMNDVRWKK